MKKIVSDSNNKNIMKKRIKTQKVSLEIQIVVFVALIVSIGNILLGVGLYNGAKSLINKQVNARILGTAENATLYFSGDELDGLGKSCENDQILALKTDLTNRLIRLIEKTQADYFYIIQKDDQGRAYFTVSSEEDPAETGDEYELVEGMVLAFNGTSNVDKEPTEDEWGIFISGYAPIYNSLNEVVAIIGVDYNYADIKAQLTMLRTQFIFMFFVIILLMSFGCYTISMMLRKGFNTLNNKVLELADGSGDLNREVVIKEGNEFTVIGNSINSFIKEVRNMVSNVADRADSTARTLSKINEQVTELSANMEECSSTTDAVSDKLSLTSDHVNEMANQMESTDKMIAEAFKNAILSSNTAMQHKEDAVEEINSIQENIRNASEQAKAVDKVKEITSRIEKIASESRILALNAQIEAARAGEAGRGFAVVAEEMGDLNNQIANAVSEIADINDVIFDSVQSLLKGIHSMDDYLSEHVLPDYDAYASLGKEYGGMSENMRNDISELTNHAQIIAEEVVTATSSIKDINIRVSDSATQINKVNVASNQISNEMNKLTQMSMLKMVDKK